MNSPAKDIKHRLVNLTIVGAAICFIGEEPAEPNNCVTIYDTGGSDPFANIGLKSPTVQVRVRNTDYAAGYALQESIQNALITTETFELNNARYIGVWGQGDIIFIGRDENNRAIFTANYRIERQAI